MLRQIRGRMNLKLVKKNNVAIDEAEIAVLSRKLNLPAKFIELLFNRGISDEQAINRFLFPDEKNFHDPFLMKGMRAAVERLNAAIKNGERIVVYGDYDVDGVCSSAILSLYLAERGVEVYTHIPSRINEGYGLNNESIEKILENCNPDIILTCDCGISGYKEIEYAQDLGVEVIVTDHHEVSENIPDCIVVNPHQVDCDYPFEYLCGAGVALKLVEAMGGMNEARKYWELAAVATIADLVPLVDENRLIVQMGLTTVRKIKNLGLKSLLINQKITDTIQSSDIAFKIAPRLNAAGRMGDAYNAFELLTTADLTKIASLIDNINEDNNKRKSVCTKLYEEAIEDLKKEDIIDRRCIILSHPEWEKGITGIVAARLSGEFNRPSFILVKSGNAYKGTARSIPNVNIYSLLSYAGDLLIEYGGHSQAAGFSIESQNIEPFKERVSEYLKQFPREYFEPTLTYDVEITESEVSAKLIKCLDLLEPTGNSNTKPLFMMSESKLRVQPCKSNIMHTQITLPDNMQVFAFNNYNKNHFLTSEGQKSFVIELQTNSFNGRESVRGILRGISIERLTFSGEVAAAAFIKMSALSGNVQPKFTIYAEAALNDLIGDNLYGTLIVCGSQKTYQKFLADYNGSNINLHDFMFSSVKNNYSRVIVSPEFDDNLNLHGYNKIIFLDMPISMDVVSFINENCNATVYLPSSEQYNVMENVSLEREVFAYYYDAFKRFRDIKAVTLWGYYKILASRIKVSLRQFITCLLVFIDIGFISITSGEFSLKFNSGVKADLKTSELYKRFVEYKERYGRGN
ncbi:MAG: single-stranded-DNA-specific exonuclease RecJ [Clostridiales bacterium]|nr:single-stranded-DNA-specific exonuclease RecJ [Clostridiales bacterium]